MSNNGGLAVIAIVGLVYIGFMFAMGHNESVKAKQEMNAAMAVFAHNRYNLPASQVRCDMDTGVGESAYVWCSFPLDGRIAWAVCTRNDGCFTRY